MFLISDAQSALVSDVVSDNRSPFREDVLEKDLVITKVLELVATLNTSPFQLAFGGGTSLVKARGLMDRLSEDVDLKVITPTGLSHSKRRSVMREIRSEFQELLKANYFSGVTAQAKYDGGYSQLNIPYQSRYKSDFQIESSIKLEFFAQVALAPTTTLQVQSLAHTFAGVMSETQMIEVIALEETLAKKVVAFLSRLDQIERNPKIIRHVYDIWRVRELSKDRDLMQEIFDFSIDELSSRHRVFTEPAIGFRALNSLTKDLADSPKTEAAYNLQLPAIASTPPSFKEAAKQFSILAAALFSGSSYSRALL